MKRSTTSIWDKFKLLFRSKRLDKLETFDDVAHSLEVFSNAIEQLNNSGAEVNQAILKLNQNNDKIIPNMVQLIDIVADISKSVAEGFSVPGYQILSSPGQAESGVALYIKTKPLIEHREFRAKLNRPQINKLFEIEKNLIEHHAGMELGDVKQVWNPGQYVIPEDETEKSSRIKQDLDAHLISYVQAIKERHNLATDDQAKEYIQKIQDHDSEFAAPKAAKSSLPVGLNPRQ